MRAIRPRGFATSVLFAAALSGCADRTTPAALPDGIDADALPTLALEEEVRMGSATDSTLGFSQVSGIEVGSDGTVYVLEGRTREIRVFDPEGRLVRTAGGSGSGDGQISGVPTGFQILGDTLAVFESLGASRISLFDRSGEHIATIAGQSVPVPTPEPALRLSVKPAHLRSDGRFEGRVIYGVATAAGEGPPAIPDSVIVPRILFDRNGVAADTVGSYAFRFPSSTLIGRMALNRAPPLPSSPLRSAMSAGVVDAAGIDTIVVERPVAPDAAAGVFEVLRIQASGDTAYRRRFRYRPVPVRGAFKDSVVSARLAPYADPRETANLAEVQRTLETSLEWPAFHPPLISVMTFGDDVWLQREAGGREARWIVLGANGAPRGQLAISPRRHVHWIDGDRVWVLELDRDDVPWVVRYRLTGG